MRFAVKVNDQLGSTLKVNLRVIHFVEGNVGVPDFKEDFGMAKRPVCAEELSELGL